MRPAYRTALVALLLSGLLLAGVLWISAHPPAPQPEVTPRTSPLTIAPGSVPPGPPTDARVTDALDRLEEAEAARFGADEAARRRRTREQIVRQRLDPEATGER